jgi:tetratricopeptide (TPR) repeat protein
MNALLVFLLMRAMTGAFWRPLFVAAAFALHPLHVESVAWIAERKDVLSQAFWLLAIWGYVSYTAQIKGSIAARCWYALALVLLALGLMSKPMLVTAPFLFLLLDYWPLQRLEWGSAARVRDRDEESGALVPPRQLLIEKIPFLVLVAASSIITFRVQEAAGAVNAFPLWHRLDTAFTAYVRYIGKFIWPTDLAVLYPNHVGMWAPAVVVGAAALLVAITTAVLYARRPYLFVGWFWFLGTLVPAVGFIQVGSQSMADRYMYMPMTGLLVMLAWGVGEFCERIPPTQRVIAKRASAIAAVLALALCARLTIHQVGLWSDSRTLFEYALRVTKDNEMMHNNLGNVLKSEERYEEAAAHYRAAIQAAPGFSLPHNNLGNTLMKLGQLPEAVQSYRSAVALAPDDATVHSNLGVVLGMQGNFGEAAVNFREVLRLEPENLDAINSLGLALSLEKRWDEAIGVYEDGLRLAPADPRLHAGLANALRHAGRSDDAIPHYRTSLQKRPDHFTTWNTLGIVLATTGHMQEAADAFREALRIDPVDKGARQNLARAEALLATPPNETAPAPQ